MGIEDCVTEGDLLKKCKQDFEKQIKEDKPYIEKFCEEQTEEYKRDVRLEMIDLTNESNPFVFELMYYFSDESGGYTIEGIKNSLKE